MRKIVFAALAAIALLCSAAIAATANWAVNHTPAVNTQASASRAAGNTTQRHFGTSCSGSITTVAAQVAITLSLRDGATGAGTVLWSQATTCAINTPCALASPPLNVAGSNATAMTCEWSGAPST